jgi:Eukaryotic aspartyl protease
MPQSIRLPATILTTGSYYTARLGFGAAGVTAELILDTGSAVLAVDGAAFDPVAGGCTTTTLMQQAQYLSGTSLCAVVTGAVTLGDGAPVQIQDANIGVTYGGAGVFGSAGGVWGLAYQGLDAALQMPADTWASKYDASEISLGSPRDIAPLFDQLTAEGLLGRQFAFRINRAMPRQALADPATDPLNAGLFVAGGGMECDDLHSGPFSAIAVVHETYYNVNLLSVQVGDAPPIAVQPPPAGSSAASTAFVDSGMPNLMLDQGLFNAVAAALQAVNPSYAAAVARQAAGGEDQAVLNLAAWPQLVFNFQAADGGVTSVTVGPTAYWQEDAAGPGRAVVMLVGDGYRFGGQSVLGLPFFAGNYVVFDRTALDGRGAVAVAPGA